MIENLAMGFMISLQPHNILYCLAGCVVGQAVGVLPGLGPTATIGMLLALTYNLDLTSSIIMLSGIFYGTQYGGTITSVLMKIPGEAASVVTAIDGYAMALRGEAGKALGIAAFGSFIAGTAGTLIISVMAPPLSRIALLFGASEYAMLMLLGLTLVIHLGSESKIKAVLMGAMGLALGTIGMDSVTAVERFTFGAETLMEGLNVAVVAMGLFGIGEILVMAESGTARALRDSVRCPEKIRDLLPNRHDWKISLMPISRGTLLGFLLGILPGGGVIIASFASYGTEKRLSRNPERFGKGAIEGVAGPETANNAAVSGAFIPLLTLGIPANVVMALLMGAFILHGVVPGPFIIDQHPKVFWGVITSMYVGNAILLILNIPLIKWFVKITEIPFAILSPIVVMICVIGAFSINNNPVDVLIMMAFGGLGFLMKKFQYEPAPLLLAYVIGPLLESSLRKSLILSHGSLSIFWTRPISMALFMIFVLIVLSGGLGGPLKRILKRSRSVGQGAVTRE